MTNIYKLEKNGEIFYPLTHAKAMILKSPNGTQFVLSVADDGTLSATAKAEDSYGNITVDKEAIEINEGSSTILKVKLDTAPTLNQIVNITNTNPVVTVEPKQLLFTNANYDTYQDITIKVFDDGDTIDYNLNFILTSVKNSKTITLNVKNTTSLTPNMTEPEYGVIFTVKSNTDNTTETTIFPNNRDFEVYSNTGSFIESVSQATGYTFNKSDTLYKIKQTYEDVNMSLDYAFQNISSITCFDYISLPPGARGGTRFISSCSNLEKITKFKLNGSAVFPQIEVCNKLTTIESIEGIENIKEIKGLNCANLRGQLNASDWWDRTEAFTIYRDVFKYSKYPLDNPDMPVSWGGTKSIPVTSVNFKSTTPVNNPTNYTIYNNYIENIQPRYANFGVFSINSPNGLLTINNQNTGQIVYSPAWETFTGTETCEMKYTDSSGNVLTSIQITLTKDAASGDETA